MNQYGPLKRNTEVKKYYLMSILMLFSWFALAAENATTEIIVYKDPNCGCCSKWSEHLRQNNFSVTEVAVDDISVYKSKYNVPANLSSCHTATVQGYVMEGHVPAADISKVLAEKPDIIGLTVPGMPLGSPGMEVAGRSQAYDVLAIHRDGTTTVFHSYSEK